jgi:MFS superfamily sulfate permease-like transporter
VTLQADSDFIASDDDRVGLAKWAVPTLGTIPAGFLWSHLSAGFLPDTVRLLPDVGGIGLICFCSSMVAAKSFAVRNGYEAAPDREFIAPRLSTQNNLSRRNEYPMPKKWSGELLLRPKPK